MSTNERRERFKKVAARRVQKIIDSLESLSNCSNRGNYEYSEEDVRKMFKAIREQIGLTETMFDNQLNKKDKKGFKF